MYENIIIKSVTLEGNYIRVRTENLTINEYVFEIDRFKTKEELLAELSKQEIRNSKVKTIKDDKKTTLKNSLLSSNIPVEEKSEQKTKKKEIK
jgi:hypothetical protein